MTPRQQKEVAPLVDELRRTTPFDDAPSSEILDLIAVIDRVLDEPQSIQVKLEAVLRTRYDAVREQRRQGQLQEQERRSKTAEFRSMLARAAKVDPNDVAASPEQASLQELFSGLKRGRDFKGVDHQVLRSVIERSCADAESYVNDGPTLGAFLGFMQRYVSVTCYGKTMSNGWIHVEGLEHRGPVDADLREAFERFCYGADDLVCDEDRLFAWWD